MHAFCKKEIRKRNREKKICPGRGVLGGELNMFEVSLENDKRRCPLEMKMGKVLSMQSKVQQPPTIPNANEGVDASHLLPPCDLQLCRTQDVCYLLSRLSPRLFSSKHCYFAQNYAPRCDLIEHAPHAAIEHSTELTTLLHTLGYDQYSAALAHASVCGMAELTATSKVELHKIGVLSPTIVACLQTL